MLQRQNTNGSENWKLNGRVKLGAGLRRAKPDEGRKAELDEERRAEADEGQKRWGLS